MYSIKIISVALIGGMHAKYTKEAGTFHKESIEVIDFLSHNVTLGIFILNYKVK